MTKEMWMGLGGLAVVFLSIPAALLILSFGGHTVGAVILAGLVSAAGGAAGAYLVKFFWELRPEKNGGNLYS